MGIYSADEQRVVHQHRSNSWKFFMKFVIVNYREPGTHSFGNDASNNELDNFLRTKENRYALPSPFLLLFMCVYGLYSGC